MPFSWPSKHNGKNGLPIHREAPAFEELSTATEVLFTGIKVIDLIEPYAKGGKIGLFGGAGVGKGRTGAKRKEKWNSIKDKSDLCGWSDRSMDG